jgi:hypothetical protein
MTMIFTNAESLSSLGASGVDALHTLSKVGLVGKRSG